MVDNENDITKKPKGSFTKDTRLTVDKLSKKPILTNNTRHPTQSKQNSKDTKEHVGFETNRGKNKHKNLKKRLTKKRNKVKGKEATPEQRQEINKLAELDKAAKGKKGILTKENTENYTAPNDHKMVEEDFEVVWRPNPGKQEDFLRATEVEVLFSGGRGSGKSDCLLVDCSRWCDKKEFRALILRRTMPELRELISRAKELFPKIYPGTKWKEQEKMFNFPSGAKVEFGYCDREDDAQRYQGQEYTYLGIDEIAQFESSNILNKLKASLRTNDNTIPIQIRCTCNPSGKGKNWVKDYWIDKGPEGKRLVIPFETPMGTITTTRKWFKSTVQEDNPQLLENSPQYLGFLASLPEVLRKQWMDCNWDVEEGLAFPEFDRNKHVCESFDIPNNWYKFRACDWGYAALAVCLWIAVDFDGNLYIYRELAVNRITAPNFARIVLSMEEGEKISDFIIDGSIWDRRGESGPSIAEEMIREGCRWRPADKSKGSRESSKLLVHKYLQPDQYTEKPKIQIFDTCRQLIKELGSLPLSETNPEDTETKGVDDHAYDALRYGLMTRPDNSFQEEYKDFKKSRPPVIIDPSFGY